MILPQKERKGVIMKKRLLVTLAIVMFLIVGTVCSANATLITDEDFESGASGWNNNLTTNGGTTFTTFLGRHGGSAGAQSLYKDFNLSGNQTDVHINFSFYEIDSWDNNEWFYIYVNDTVVRQDPYQHDIPDAPIGTVDLFGGASSPNTNYGFEPSWYDQGIGYSFNYATTDTNLRLGFGAILGEGIGDESWGIDNVLITDNYDTAPVPEPCTMLLFGTGLAGLGLYRKKKGKV